MPKSTGEEWFGVPPAARCLGLYLTTLYRLINARDLPEDQIGRVTCLRRVEVDAYIERSRVRRGDLDHLLYGPDYDETESNDGGQLDATTEPVIRERRPAPSSQHQPSAR